MYRVELKDDCKEGAWCDLIEFLMYRVELKVFKGYGVEGMFSSLRS